ncbi:hypothetical protein EA76_02817 [Enterococcus faecalis]|nr:hypothetical protein EA76_02817 [Enterococcus faecalis]
MSEFVKLVILNLGFTLNVFLFLFRDTLEKRTYRILLIILLIFGGYIFFNMINVEKLWAIFY